MGDPSLLDRAIPRPCTHEREHVKTVPLLLLLCATAMADVATDAANHTAVGKKAFADGKYTEAIAAFREAHKLAPDPKLLYAIAQAQRMANDCTAAIATYEEIIKANQDTKLVEYSHANITRCKQILASQKADPVPAKEPVKPIEPVPVPPVPVPPVRPRIESGRSWTGDWVGHGLVAAGVGAAIVGTILWTGGRSDAAALNDAGNHEAFLAAQDQASSALTRQRIGIALGIAGAGAIVGGVLHYRSTASKKEVRIGASPARGGGAFVARITF